MSDLQIRRIDFAFDDVDFHWNPQNKPFSVFINVISFWVIGLEKYFVRAMREAEARIDDPAVLAEARAFRQQEAVHAASHRRHVNALIDRYPELQSVLDDVVARYDELYESRDLDYHLAYAAALEGTFTPVFKLFIDHRDTLFADGDARVASLTLWHFCEEVEHRSSAVIVYDHVVGDTGYKIRTFPSAVVHLDSCFESIYQGFQRAVPGEAGADHHARRLRRYAGGPRTNPIGTVPRRTRMRSSIRALRSLGGSYDHEHQPLPRYAAEWFARFDEGEDMRQVYGVRRDEVSA